MSGRFRLLGGSGEAPDPAPPEFGTAPWGYRRSEVDAWASWVAGLVAHGRNETVRADSAEATLKATLERLEQLQQPEQPEHTDPPERPATRTAGRLHFDPPTDLPRRTARAAGAAAEDAATEAPPRDHDLARIRVVETTLHEVMDLLRHLAGPRGRATGGDTTAPLP